MQIKDYRSHKDKSIHFARGCRPKRHEIVVASFNDYPFSKGARDFDVWFFHLVNRKTSCTRCIVFLNKSKNETYFSQNHCLRQVLVLILAAKKKYRGDSPVRQTDCAITCTYIHKATRKIFIHKKLYLLTCVNIPRLLNLCLFLVILDQ